MVRRLRRPIPYRLNVAADEFDADVVGHITRSVFLVAEVGIIAAFETAYRTGGESLDGLLDLRRLGLEPPEIAGWLASAAGIAISPGHWFGRQGAGFARMTIAVPSETIEHTAKQSAVTVGVRTCGPTHRIAQCRRVTSYS